MEELWLRQKYLVDHLTLQEIADELGCSRQNVYHFVKRYHIDSSKAEWVNFKCDTCGKDSRNRRQRWRDATKHFCSFECYKVYLRKPEYRQWRQGQRIARQVMEAHLHRSLRAGEVVHHIDGDNKNNDITNLMLFPNNADHTKYHHKLRQTNK